MGDGISAGTHQLGPDHGTLRVHTYREGVAARVGHDLIIEVGEWQGQVVVAPHGALEALELSAGPRSLAVREGLRGVKPLTDRDRADIRRTIDERVLRGMPIAFRSHEVEHDGATLRVRGELTLGGATRPLSFALALAGSGRLSGTASVRQSDWGITPYRGLMGALRVRDEVDVVVDVALPTA